MRFSLFRSASAARISLAAFALAAAFSTEAFAADRWEQAGSGAVAMLPVPSKAQGIVGASLSCAEQRWSFRLRTDPAAFFPSSGDATIQIDAAKLSASAGFEAGVLTIPIAYESLDALKTATRLTFTVGEAKDAPSASFSLRNSKAVIEAIAPLCSQIDMTGYDRVTLSDTDAAVDQATPLLAAETELFRTATKKQPVYAAAIVDAGDGKSLLFATLCGSTWYYGRSGCTLDAYAKADASSSWQEVFNSEGVVVYVDPRNRDRGWPNLVTLPLVGGTEPMHWSWTGSRYELADRIAENAEAGGENDAQ